MSGCFPTEFHPSHMYLSDAIEAKSIRSAYSFFFCALKAKDCIVEQDGNSTLFIYCHYIKYF